MKTLQEGLDWYANKKWDRKPLFDFGRPVGHSCAKCGYPAMVGKPGYPLKWLECPEHQPGWLKYKGTQNAAPEKR